jgi:hypothetical protein
MGNRIPVLLAVSLLAGVNSGRPDDTVLATHLDALQTVIRGAKS